MIKKLGGTDRRVSKGRDIYLALESTSMVLKG